MSKLGAVNFPRINMISLLTGALALASVFLPWWGIDASGFGSSVSSRWTLWNGPSTDSIFRGSTQPYPTLTSASPIIGALVVISGLLAIAGSFTWNIRPLIGSFILSVLTPIVYLGVVSYSVTNSCGGQSNCLSGPFGTETVFGITLNWGFQLGFYLYLFAGALTLVGLGFHRIFHKTTSTRETPQSFCVNKLGSGPNCEAHCRRARVCSKLGELPGTIEPVLVLCQRHMPMPKFWFS